MLYNRKEMIAGMMKMRERSEAMKRKRERKKTYKVK